jgi:hypothetical protein
MPLPTTGEQQEVASFIGDETTRLDELTAEANRAISLLQERRTALISAAVTGKIDVRKDITFSSVSRNRIQLVSPANCWRLRFCVIATIIPPQVGSSSRS